ncbi:hypothetical protein JRO89_XS14G0101900 [Xanthoceras sorbifolium]|uniref:Protein kinase domain-containing protein n=1 Tax=Xanthoceras sorbifolium TaxID=99658 RepID=A0ABQ8H4X8_9ROSI|nr:hypothetical protein JRO89_XS14G0101900 [Xanthoceras sorbifolium]
MLLKGTDGFSLTHFISVGSFGSVYKGILDKDGTIVAMKILNLQHQGASKSFMAECKALRNIRHRNHVKVKTSCSSIDFEGNDFKAIVYEFVANRSLEKWLHPTLESEEEQKKKKKIQSLTILQRISIATDMASPIKYLLHYYFGLARFRPKVPNVNQSSSIGYGLGNEISTNGDVYSFGILLLETVTRIKPTDVMFKGDFNLRSFARMALLDRVMDIADPMLMNEEIVNTNHRMRQALYNNQEECLISMVRIGVACSVESPHDRMNISRVVHELQSEKKLLLQPTNGLNDDCKHKQVAHPKPEASVCSLNMQLACHEFNASDLMLESQVPAYSIKSNGVQAEVQQGKISC